MAALSGSLPENPPASDAQWFPVASYDKNLRDYGGRVHIELKGRAISIVNYRGTLYCIDAVCFHAGGPLTLGDIEEVAGRPCVSCPWHNYKITLDSGDKLFDALEKDPKSGKLVPAGWKAMPGLQRTHECVVGSDRKVYVRLSTDVNLPSSGGGGGSKGGGEVRSDGYAHDKRTAAAAFGDRISVLDDTQLTPCARPP
jgi:nitrite reductase/ring-hydroxylating ferredoxin subunit